MKKTKSIALILGVLIMSLGAGYLAIAWTEPGQAPPAGNVSDPLNVSLTAQSKEGALVLATNSGVTTGLIVQYGSVGIGTTTPTQKLEVAGNVKLYKSGMFPNVSMADAWGVEKVRIHTNGYSWFDGGNVGIGTTNPGAKLEVAGTGKFTGAVDMTSQKITSLAGPTDTADAATKGYVDAQSGGGYLLETRCGWRTCSSYNAVTLGSCAPPGCPTGYTDRGTGCYPVSMAYAVSSQYSHSAYPDTNCSQGPYSTTQSSGAVGLCYRWCEK